MNGEEQTNKHFKYNISINYLIPENEFINSLTVEECVNAVGYSIIPIITYDTEKEILDINDYEPDVYQNSTYKKVYYCQEVYNVNPNGYQFRSNVSGRSTIYQLSRLSTWEIKAQNRKNNKSPIKSKFIENKQIDTESLKCVFDIAQKDKLISTIDSFMKHNSYASPFIDEVTEEISSDYQNVIAVQMNLNCIITNLDNEKYRSKEMLMFDLKQIELNCIEYNGADSNFSKDAHKLYENLKKQLEQFSSYRLRSMPQRGASGRVRGVSNASEQSEPKVNNKRNPKKSNNKRSLRKRQEQDDEEDKYSDQFKKPTPVKYQKIDEEENDYIKTKDNFKIQLDNINASTGIRRSTRSRIPVIDENNIEARPSKALQSVKQTKAKAKKRQKEESESDQDYNPTHNLSTRAAARGKAKRPNYKEEISESSEDEYIDDDDDDEDY